MHVNSSLKARAQRRTAIGIALSVLLHVGLFALLWYQIDEVIVPVRPDPDTAPLVVSFLKDTPAPSSTAISAPPPKPARQPPAKRVTAPKTPKAPKVVVHRPAAIALAEPAPSPVQSAQQPPEQPQEVKPAPPEMDMSTMINAARERRRAAAEAAAPINSEAQGDSSAPADNAVAKSNIQFLMRRGEGGGGVFQIISKGPRVAQYVFRGWGATAHESRRQLIEVDAGEDGDIEVAIIKSMIELIRKRYPGDFKWDSQRLGRLVDLSARETDGPALQAFLMREFFGGH